MNKNDDCNTFDMGVNYYIGFGSANTNIFAQYPKHRVKMRFSIGDHSTATRLMQMYANVFKLVVVIERDRARPFSMCFFY